MEAILPVLLFWPIVGLGLFGIIFGIIVLFFIIAFLNSLIYQQFKTFNMSDDEKKAFEENQLKEANEAIERFNQGFNESQQKQLEDKYAGKSYIIFETLSKWSLEKNVNEAIRFGFEPVGSPEGIIFWKQAVKKIG